LSDFLIDFKSKKNIDKIEPQNSSPFSAFILVHKRKFMQIAGITGYGTVIVNTHK